jgi:hypothetical protein
MTKEFYCDPCGCTASILRHPDGRSLLSVRSPQGVLIHGKTYTTYRGARIALGKISDGTMTRKEVR